VPHPAFDIPKVDAASTLRRQSHQVLNQTCFGCVM